jgi:hypothetical protein
MNQAIHDLVEREHQEHQERMTEMLRDPDEEWPASQTR